MARVFVLEDDPQRVAMFAEVLRGHEVEWHASCAYEHAFQPPYDIILLDHDLGGSQMGMKHGRPLSISEAEDCGLTFCRMVRDRINKEARIFIHSYNPGGALRMQQELEEVGLVAQRSPFGPTLLRDLRIILSLLDELDKPQEM